MIIIVILFPVAMFKLCNCSHNNNTTFHYRVYNIHLIKCHEYCVDFIIFPFVVKRKRDSSSGLLMSMEKSDVRDERLLEQGQAMLQEVHTANTEFLKVLSRIELNSHSMLGLVDRIVKVMETNNKS